MIKKICIWGAVPVIVILAFIIAIPVRDHLISSIGEGATNLLIGLWAIFTSFIIITQLTGVFARYAIGVFIIFITLSTLLIVYYTSPEQKYKRALENSQQLQLAVDMGLHKADRSHYKNDRDYSDAVEYANNEEKAVQLELELAELRNYPSYHLYGIKPWEKIGFISAIGLILTYGICWLIAGNKVFKKEVDTKNY
jgi:hypothetical protein